MANLDLDAPRQISFWIEDSDPAFGGSNVYSCRAESLRKALEFLLRKGKSYPSNDNVVVTDETTNERFRIGRNQAIVMPL